MPETVFMLAPLNLATSRSELNMPSMKAVLRKILTGWPTSFSFFTTWKPWCTSSAVPVPATRKPVSLFERYWNASTPVLGGHTGP